MKFERGSEWRKWDLHIHTPASIQQGYGGEESWDDFIRALENLPSEVKVVGITDYYFIDGYKKVMQHKNKGRLSNLDKIFPILEFRIDTFGSGNENKLQKINLHILFDINETDIANDIKIIEEQFIDRIPISSVESHKTVPLSKENFIKFGGNLQSGFESLVPPTNRVLELLENPTWKDKTILFLGYKEWSNLEKNQQIKPIKQDLYNKVSGFFTTNINTFNKSQEWLNEFGNKKLLFSGDIHDFSFLDTATTEVMIGKKQSQYECYTWIKSDPTFIGLKHALHTSHSRIFIGRIPPLFSRVKDNSTKYINKLNIKKKDTYTDSQNIWFEKTEVKLNNELVAIIGNKGQGKSALADILGLCGETNITKASKFSFLNENKFRDKKQLAKNFFACIQWANENQSGFINLFDDPTSGVDPRVKYLSQGYFEDLCNEISNINIFNKEIEQVVFQYIPEYEKLSFDNFTDFVENSINKKNYQKIQNLKQQIILLNKKIIELEDKTTDEYKNKIKSKFEKKNEEFNTHLKNIPIEVKKPDDKLLNAEQNDMVVLLDTYRIESQEINNTIERYRKDIKNLAIEINELTSLADELAIKQLEIENYIKDKEAIFTKYNIKNEKIISVEFNIKPIEILKTQRKIKRDEIKEMLDEKNPKSLTEKLRNKEAEIKSLSERISKPEKDYQIYCKIIKDWENRKREIEGEKDMPETLLYFRQELDYLETKLNDEIESNREIRRKLTIDIYKSKKEMQNEFDQLKKDMEKALIDNDAVINEYQFKIVSSLKIEETFINKILNLVDRRIGSSFRGTLDGQQFFKKEIFDQLDIDSEESMSNFLIKIIEYLEKDNKTNIVKLVKDRDEFYSYLFSLDYIQPSYELRQNDKPLEQLSPGEKGTLLLIFFLLLDKDDIPLILDQPEDNLDNYSVAKILVPFIKKAKERRQIIMVTHNPNLAIFADAEQIIYVDIDKQNGNRFSHISGSIENPKLNEKIIQVLEGTMPAFNCRKNKYFSNGEEL